MSCACRRGDALARNGGFASRRGTERSRGAGVRHPGAAHHRPAPSAGAPRRAAQCRRQDRRASRRGRACRWHGGAGDRCAAPARLPEGSRAGAAAGLDRARAGRGRADRARRHRAVGGRSGVTCASPAGHRAGRLPAGGPRQPPRHDRRHRHRVPPRHPRRGPAYPILAQARQACAPAAPARGVGAAVQVARRSHHPGPRSGRVPARPARDDRLAAGHFGRRPGAIPGVPRGAASRRASHPPAGAARGPAAAAARRLADRAVRAGRLRAIRRRRRLVRRCPGASQRFAGTPAGRPRWHRDLRLLPTGSPAPAAEAVQGAALRAGDVRAGARRRAGRQGDQRPQDAAGRARPVPGLGGAANDTARVRPRDGCGQGPGRGAAGHGRAHGPSPRGAAARPCRVRHRLRVLHPAKGQPSDGKPHRQQREAAG